MTLDIGQVAYAAYRKAMMISNPMDYFPVWEEILKREQDAWRQAATEAIQYTEFWKND